jgi:hypothetical protein
LLGKIRGEKRDIYGETREKEYSKVLLERGEISLGDYEEALNDVQTETSVAEKKEDDTSYDGTEE